MNKYILFYEIDEKEYSYTIHAENLENMEKLWSKYKEEVLKVGEKKMVWLLKIEKG